LGKFATLEAEDVNGDVWTYTASEMYIHSKSEHTLNGLPSEMEL